eukprot:CAMPEP_0204607766 /NCGR_PEP_ID=MMETSP0661-20131031/59914_1 /ASSEMBLY_ACC=CAM_ASM_000606 /TAXON_ID=109239 /ORGANISM="Alexandrium margalefi, Strain AMGDE01CS-322" /LENGTH=71 /DNA_ID=CAMNT_0051619209 /DNA_START=72 /DNA_END=284 /DNA_ORIENTATION=+
MARTLLVGAALLLAGALAPCQAVLRFGGEIQAEGEGKPKQFVPKANGNEGRAGSNNPRRYYASHGADVGSA